MSRRPPFSTLSKSEPHRPSDDGAASTVEEGLCELEKLCVLELVHPESGKVVARQVPQPSAHQQELLDAFELKLPATVPEADVIVGTRKKINQVRKTLEK